MTDAELDRFILSNGHASRVVSMALWDILEHKSVLQQKAA